MQYPRNLISNLITQRIIVRPADRIHADYHLANIHAEGNAHISRLQAEQAEDASLRAKVEGIRAEATALAKRYSAAAGQATKKGDLDRARIFRRNAATARAVAKTGS